MKQERRASRSHPRSQTFQPLVAGHLLDQVTVKRGHQVSLYEFEPGILALSEMGIASKDEPRVAIVRVSSKTSCLAAAEILTLDRANARSQFSSDSLPSRRSAPIHLTITGSQIIVGFK